MPRLQPGMCPALTESVCEKLKNARIENVNDFITADPEEITKKSTIPFQDVLAIRRVVLAQLSALPVNGADLYDYVLTSAAILPTGCESLDELLDGGVYSTEITEVVGGAASGKTQVCLNTAASIITGTQQNVVYVDTGSSFDVSRLSEILETKGVSTEQELEGLLSKIKVVRAFDVFELLTELETIKHQVAQQADPFYCGVKLVIVDCVAAVISPILGGQQREGQCYLSHVSRALKTLATEFTLAVLVTNNLVHGEAGSMKPALGKSWLNVPNTRLEVSKLDNSLSSIPGGDARPVRRRAVLLKSGRQPIGQHVEFEITEAGLQCAGGGRSSR